jgi:cytochrome c2
MRRLALATALALACTTQPIAVAPTGSEATPEAQYLHDAKARRRALEDELVNPSNGYSALRLAHYATGKAGDWDALDVYNPPAAPLTTGEGEPLVPFAIDPKASAGDREALRALGERAFFRYPVQTATAAERVIDGEDTARRFGMGIADGRIGGLIRVKTPDGMAHLAYSCATCHAGTRDGKTVVGAPTETLDLGALVLAGFPSTANANLRQWGPGRLDVTTAQGTEPVRIPDLRAIREVSFLHHAATVAQRDVVSLAIRLETLVIVSNSQVIRPPREVALGLAVYLHSLADALPHRAPATDAERRGATLFEAQGCTGCHVPPKYSGAPVALSEVGTDPQLGSSADRGTGRYRVPSLRGVADRGPLLHDASISTVDELLDPARFAPTFQGRRGTGAVPGHPFGTKLPLDERAALAAFVRTL